MGMLTDKQWSQIEPHLPKQKKEDEQITEKFLKGYYGYYGQVHLGDRCLVAEFSELSCSL